MTKTQGGLQTRKDKETDSPTRGSRRDSPALSELLNYRTVKQTIVLSHYIYGYLVQPQAPVLGIGPEQGLESEALG